MPQRMRQEHRYVPFRGLSAWFSCSVHPEIVKQWDLHGGSYESQYNADFLFSDSIYAEDTMRARKKQETVAVFRSSLVEEVLAKHASVPDIAIGKHVLIPHTANSVANSQPFSSPKTSSPSAKPTQVQTKPNMLQRVTDTAGKQGCLGDSRGNDPTQSSSIHCINQPGLTKHSAIINIGQLEPFLHRRLVDFIPNHGDHHVVRKPITDHTLSHTLTYKNS